jgi:hypothetical protein
MLGKLVGWPWEPSATRGLTGAARIGDLNRF